MVVEEKEEQEAEKEAEVEEEVEEDEEERSFFVNPTTGAVSLARPG